MLPKLETQPPGTPFIKQEPAEIPTAVSVASETTSLAASSITGQQHSSQTLLEYQEKEGRCLTEVSRGVFGSVEKDSSSVGSPMLMSEGNHVLQCGASSLGKKPKPEVSIVIMVTNFPIYNLFTGFY